MTAFDACSAIKDALTALEALDLPPRVRFAIGKHHNALAASLLDHGEAMGLTSAQVVALGGGTNKGPGQ